MSKPKRSIDQRLLEAQQAIDASLNNPAILQAVALMGYDQARLQAARALYDEVMALVAAQQREYGEQYEASAALQAAWDAADLAYKRTLKLCRIAFRDQTKAQNTLGLYGSRKKSLSGWIEQATTFYINLLGTADLMAALATTTDADWSCARPLTRNLRTFQGSACTRCDLQTDCHASHAAGITLADALANRGTAEARTVIDVDDLDALD